jgi:hypothetical protein
MFTAGKAVALTGLDYLEDAAKVEQARTEWRARVEQRGGPPTYA